MQAKPRWGRLVSAVVGVRWYAASSRSRDGDNALASLKAAFDGLADAGVVDNDSGITHLPVSFSIDLKRPRVELYVFDPA